MGFDLGAVYIANHVAQNMLHEKLYGKPQAKVERRSFFSKLVKRMKK